MSFQLSRGSTVRERWSIGHQFCLQVRGREKTVGSNCPNYCKHGQARNGFWKGQAKDRNVVAVSRCFKFIGNCSKTQLFRGMQASTLNALLQITKHYDFPLGSVLRKQICAIIAKQLCFQVAWLELKNKWDHMSLFSLFLFFLSLFVSVSLSVSLSLSSSLPTLLKSSGNALQDIGWQALRAPFQYWQCYVYHLQYGSYEECSCCVLQVHIFHHRTVTFAQWQYGMCWDDVHVH